MDKVLLAVTGSGTGGAQEVTRVLLEELPGHGFLPVLVTGGEGPLLEDARRLGLAAYSLPHLGRSLRPARDLWAYRELRAVIGREQPVLLHGHSFKAGALVRLASRTTSLPAVYTIHGWGAYHALPPPLRPAWMTLERILSRWSHPVYVCPSDRQLGQEWGIPAGTVIPVGSRERGERRSSPLPACAGSPVEILTVARLMSQKDPLGILQVLGRLQREAADLPWHLTWVGGGDLEAAARREASRQGLAERISWVAETRDVAPYYRRAHLFLLFSRYEGSPLSIVEALRARLLVVATAVGGVADLLQGGQAGVLVDPAAGEAERAGILLRLLRDPDSWHALRGEGGRWAERYAAPAMAARYAALYREILSGKGSRRDAES